MKKRILLIILHLLFWLINYYYVSSGSLNWNGFGEEHNLLKKAYLYGMFFNAFLFYIQIFWLVPKFYIQNKKTAFWMFSIGIFLVINTIETFLDVQLATTYKIYDFPLFVAAIMWFYHNAIFHFIYFIVGFYYRFQQEYIKSERIKQELLVENHKAESKYLKAQLNPHFLFNGINSIYHLIGKNDVSAKNTLLKFSNLLRYQLYESNGNKIELHKELKYIKEYVSIEQIRKGSDINLNFSIDVQNENSFIMPLLLIPFIENAFKYVSNHVDAANNNISIQIKEENNILNLNVENTKDPIIYKEKSGGIGLKNVRKRLELMYQKKHLLNINSTDDKYLVTLEIELN
ncbi:sensor histidine kinase [Tenacibaculum sp. M341]|uniref:sensor histidine kinase n=1 Tax=Tenacibaculum sp. M341 TaxID=2530339 RepID=UPI0010482288|nr:histidine kinase [Tenacibaculum sp. M341]TCI92114.1 hypothetical protein EYW44_07985 [Tenacibaculum sp. M341]